MTTRGYEVSLDRLLTRQITVPGEVIFGIQFRFDTRRVGVTGADSIGEWAKDGVNLYLYETDADNKTLPMAGSLTLDASTEVTVEGEGGYTFTAVLTSYEVGRTGFGGTTPVPHVRHLVFASAPSPALPDSGDIVVTLPAAGQAPDMTVNQSVWCARRDFTGRDQVRIGDAANFSLSDTRILVRFDDSWAVGDEFTLESVSYTIRGIARVGGRKQYLEMLSRS